MPIINSDGFDRLRRAGFSESEINALNNSKDKLGNAIPVNLDSNAYQRMISERQQWINTVKGYGWTPEQISNELNGYYDKDSRRSVFDFLKAEYRPNKRQDYWNNVRGQKKAGIDSGIEGYHSGDVHTSGQEQEPERLTPEEQAMEDEYQAEEEPESEVSDESLFDEEIPTDLTESPFDRERYRPKRERPNANDEEWFPDETEWDEDETEDLG